MKLYALTNTLRPIPELGALNRLSSSDGRISRMSSRMACCPLKRT